MQLVALWVTSVIVSTGKCVADMPRLLLGNALFMPETTHTHSEVGAQIHIYHRAEVAALLQHATKCTMQAGSSNCATHQFDICLPNNFTLSCSSPSHCFPSLLLFFPLSFSSLLLVPQSAPALCLFGPVRGAPPDLLLVIRNTFVMHCKAEMHCDTRTLTNLHVCVCVYIVHWNVVHINILYR